MLSFLKKDSQKAKALQAPAWHTNFRNYALLPDTKLVRTSFFVNGGLILVALIALAAFAYQEYTLSLLRGQLAGSRQQIEKNKPVSARAVAAFKQFQGEETKVTELNNFLKGQQVVVSDLLIHLGQTKPSGIVFLNVDSRDSGVYIKGYAQGISEQATTAASAYEKQLREDPQFNKIFKAISLTNVDRDVQGGRLLFDVMMAYQLKGK
ncbi:MAG: hypothetical protein QM790_18740 [Nibricoccus sp.]